MKAFNFPPQTINKMTTFQVKEILKGYGFVDSEYEKVFFAMGDILSQIADDMNESRTKSDLYQLGSSLSNGIESFLEANY